MSRTKGSLAAKPKKIMLRDITRTQPSPEDREKVWAEIDHQENHRASAILSASILQEGLRFALIQCCARLSAKEYDKLFEQRGPLSTFDFQTQMGHALGLYGSMILRDLGVIRRVRNVFAHAMIPLSFDTPQIVAEIDLLKYIDVRKELAQALNISRKGTVRWKYTATCSLISQMLFHAGFARMTSGWPAPTLP
jgi:hypothetical protein